jgi:hypothetical protein
MSDHPNSNDLTVLTRDRAAAYLQTLGYPISKNRLAKMAVEGGGPLYQRWGGRVIYRPAELRAWAEARAGMPQSNTSEQAA